MASTAECIQESFTFAAHFSRRVEAGFTAGQLSTEDGALLLREVDREINLLGVLSGKRKLEEPLAGRAC